MEGVGSDEVRREPLHHGFMTDPRNVAHDKKVQQEKKHHGEEIAPGAIHSPQPGQKPAMKHPEPTDENTDQPSNT